VLTTRQASLDAADRSVAPPEGLLTLGFAPARFPTEPPACYRASWQLPGRDSHPLATTSLCWIRSSQSTTSNSGRAKTSTYKRRSKTVSTVRKSQASVVAACWRRNERQSGWSRCGAGGMPASGGRFGRASRSRRSRACAAHRRSGRSPRSCSPPPAAGSARAPPARPAAGLVAGADPSSGGQRAADANAESSPASPGTRPTNGAPAPGSTPPAGADPAARTAAAPPAGAGSTTLTVAVGTALRLVARAAPRADPSERI
jgi:hypothetical protein